MCKLIIDGQKLHVNVITKDVTLLDGNKGKITKVHLPKNAKCALMSSRHIGVNDKTKKIYLSRFRSGTMGHTDALGGVTLTGDIWEKMIADLNLTIKNNPNGKNRIIGPVPAVAV